MAGRFCRVLGLCSCTRPLLRRLRSGPKHGVAAQSCDERLGRRGGGRRPRRADDSCGCVETKIAAGPPPGPLGRLDLLAEARGAGRALPLVTHNSGDEHPLRVCFRCGQRGLEGQDEALLQREIRSRVFTRVWWFSWCGRVIGDNTIGRRQDAPPDAKLNVFAGRRVGDARLRHLEPLDGRAAAPSDVLGICRCCQSHLARRRRGRLLSRGGRASFGAGAVGRHRLDDVRAVRADAVAVSALRSPRTNLLN